MVEVQEAAREHTAAAVATLARICTDQTAPPAAQVAAANALLDRGWGRPMQAIEARAAVMTLEELVAASIAGMTYEDQVATASALETIEAGGGLPCLRATDAH
jgi:hypothetical protein